MRWFGIFASSLTLFLGACTCTPGRVGFQDVDGARPDTGPEGGMDADIRIDASRPDGMMSMPDASSDTETDCRDRVDNDGDSFLDCADSDCEFEVCDDIGSLCAGGGCACPSSVAASETSCGDDLDDDCDGMRDCADPECAGMTCGPGGAVCSGGRCPCESGFDEDICNNGTDDDCDMLADCADTDCIGRPCGAAGFICQPSGECTCEAQVEVCDGTDQNCNMVADDGCPQGFTTCCPMSFTFGGASGTGWADSCPTGAVLIGIAGQASTRVDQLQPICAVLRLFEDRSVRPDFAYRAERGAPIYNAAHGAAGAATFEEMCPGNEVVIGMSGHADTNLDRIQFQCGSIAIARSGPLSFRLTVTPTAVSGAYGGTGSGDMPFNVDCGMNGVVTGLSGRADTFVSQLGVTCRELQLSIR